jgi:hypothetical protein
MALDVSDLLTVVGKYIKTINTWNTLLSTTLEAQKDEIYVVLDAEDLQDLYIDLPAQFEGFKSAVSSWISTMIGEVEDILTDEAYVLEELPIFTSDVTTVLNAIFDQMLNDADTIESSVVTLGGSDADVKDFKISEYSGTPEGASEYGVPRVFVTRTLDGTQAPSSLVDAHTSYNNVEGQLAMSCDIFAKCTSSSDGAETMQLFADSPSQASYTGDAESPGVGPTISNVEGSNLIADNFDFSDWSGDNPTGWTLAGGVAGTAWDDLSGTGVGPLRISTPGVTVKQQISGLSRRTMYFFAACFIGDSSSPADTVTVKLRVENVDGLTVHKDLGSKVYTIEASGDKAIHFGFYSPNDTVNLDDIYFCFEHDAESAAPDGTCNLYRCVVAPVTYFNGLGFAFWYPIPLIEETDTDVLVNDYGSIAISNNNNGVFQTFFRKAFNIQLPTADSPTIADTLAT